MKNIFVTSCFLFLITVTYAQTGNYFLSHYTPDEERFNIVCFDMVQDSRGVFYFATQAGILQFDGRNWDLIPTKGTIYSIAISDSGEIYAAGSRGFGKIVRDELGIEMFSMLHEQSDVEYIFQILILPKRIYFLSDQNLFEYDGESGQVKTLPATPATGSFISLSEIFDTVFISTEQGGLLKLIEGGIIPATMNMMEERSVISSFRYGDDYLLATDDNRLFTCARGFRVSEIKLQDSSYVNSSVIVGVTYVNNDLIAIGTLRGGVIFANPVTGKTEEIINYSTGLPDNEVFSLLTDRNLNVWAAHAYGFTRISPYLPFRSYHNYPGLQGNLLCVTTFEGNVYAGTSLGLFVLEKEDYYDEIIYYVEVPVRRTVSVNRSRSPAQQPDITKAQREVETKESQKGGFFRFLKKKKPAEKPDTGQKNEQDAAPAVGQPDDDQKEEQTITTYRREQRTDKILRSSFYSYRKIEGVDSKISQLIQWNGKLIASGLGGAYEVRKSQPVKITDSPIRFLFASSSRNHLIASTHDDRLLQFGYEATWVEKEPIENISEPVQYIFEEGPTSVWLCGFDKVFRLTYSDSEENVQRLSFSSSNFDKTIGLYVNNEVIIASSEGFFFYDRDTQQLVEGDTLRKPVAYFASASNLWFRDKHSWYTAGTSGGHENLHLLNLFNNLRFIDADPTAGALWIITGNNELLQFNSGQVRQDEVIYPLILKAIQHEDIVTARNFLKVEQDESAFLIEVVKPDYIGNRFVEYRYLLSGLHEEWSEWSTHNNLIRFPYLPAGDYQLQVQSRDIFGRINEMTPVQLNIAPPYWKQPWFFAAEFSVFIFLVLLSFRLSYRFLIVSRLLSLLSIIMFIEFIQTAVGETFSQSSPVLDFSIQVFVAMLILPVEGFLRRYFLQALAKRNEERLQRMVNEGEKVPEYEPEYPEPVGTPPVVKKKRK
jgi:hypothetical protein